MSEEEIIEHVEYSLINPCFNNGNSTIINNEDLQGLLDLYNKEKEKNKKQSIAIIEYQDLLEKSISKDKIKEKIEVIQKKNKRRNKNGLFNYIKDFRKCITRTIRRR